MLSFRTRSSLATLLICVALSSGVWYLTQSVMHAVVPHLYNVNAPELYAMTFRSYIFTKDCGRNTRKIAETLPGAILLTDELSDECKAIGNPVQLYHRNQSMTSDENFIIKYTEAMNTFDEEYPTHGGKRLMIVEDDIVFIHRPQRALEVLVTNTLELFGMHSGTASWDCTRRGFGWLTTGGYSDMGSQCHVYDRHLVPDMASCILNHPAAHLACDIRIGLCEEHMGLHNRRFLLVQEAGLPSEMARKMTGTKNGLMMDSKLDIKLPRDAAAYDSLKNKHYRTP